MESDEHFRSRIYGAIEFLTRYGLVQIDHTGIDTAVGSSLDVIGDRVSLKREHVTDPFGDAVRAAQDVPEVRDPAYRPDDFTAPGFDADAAYRRAMGGEG